MTAHVITSPEDWLALPQASVPRMQNASEQGALYDCAKVGFALVSGSQCIGAGITEHIVPNSRYVLPTVSIVQSDGKIVIHRLPRTLGPWAYDLVALAHQGMNPFPSKVEFGQIEGRDYAELI